jgi:hypothetical protein
LKQAQAVQNETYFDSPEARALFLPEDSPMDDGDVNNNIVDVIQDRIRALQSANTSIEGWRLLIADKDKYDAMTPYEIFCVQQKADFLITALHLALEKMNRWTWHRCCEETIVRQNRYGKKLATNARIVMNWHYVFARGGSSFPNPNPTAASGRKPLPFFFENNPAARNLFTSYADANLNLLSSNFMKTEYVNSTLIPILYKEHNKDLSGEEQLLLEN